MRHAVLLLILVLVLTGCSKQESTLEVEESNTSVLEIPSVESQEQQKSLSLNIKVQEYGLRFTLEKIYIENGDIHVQILGERLLEEFSIPEPEDFVGYFYYTNGNLHKMKVCSLEAINEETWEVDYCDNVNDIDDEVFNGKIYFVMSSALISKLEGKFIRYVDSNDWSYIFSLNFEDTFIKK